MLHKIIRDFKNKIMREPVIGPFSKTIDPAFIEILGYAGFDFIIIDMEHGPNSVDNVQNLIRASQITNTLPIIRVKENYKPLISEVLDIGAGGIQVPHICNAADVMELLDTAKFAPLGKRGVCRFVRAAEYSCMDKKKYFKESNDTIIIIQLEGAEAFENIDEILEIGGYDIIFIGPYDLSQSLGVPGEINHPKVEKKVLEMVGKCKEKNIIIGNFVDTVEDAIKWIKLGVRYISYSVDVGIFYESSRDILKKILYCK